MIPSGWHRGVLSDGIELISGRHIEAAACNSEQLGMPYLTGPEDFSNGKINATKYVASPDATCGQGDILVVVKGSGTGKTIRSDAVYCISRQLMAIRSSRWSTDYLEHVIASFEKRFNSAASGLIPGITRLDILESPICVPPLPEQRKIAAILSTWDRAIELTEKLIAAKQKRKQAIIVKLFSKQRDGNSSKAKNGYRRVEVGKLVRKRFEKSCDLDKYPLHSFTIEDGVTQKTDRYERSFLLRDAENNEYSIVHYGDFVINPMNLRFGAIGRSQVQFPVTVSAYYDVFYMVDPDCDPTYLEYLLKSPFLMHTYERVSTGSLIEKKRVHFSEFEKIRIELPSLLEQQRASSILGAMDREIQLLTLKRDRCSQQKKGLMQELLTGKIRVKVDSRMVEG